MTVKSTTSILPNWPVLLALGLVILAVMAMIVTDVLIGQRVSLRTNDIIGNSQRSIVLLDSIRANAQNLSESGVTDPEAARLRTALVANARDYDPIATYEGEHAEWMHLQELLRRLKESPSHDQVARSGLANQIDSSVDQLISINWDEGRSNATEIREAHRQAIWGDVVIGGITLAVTGFIAVMLLRVLARQRRLVAEHVHALDDKARDLEAFAGRAAHDLRSPMNPIRGYADLLHESKDSPDDVAMMANRIRTAVDRMARVVDDMLALSTAGRPMAGVSSSTEAATSVLDEMGPELVGIEVTTKLDGSRIAASAGVLNQLLRNLIGNALKFRARTRPLQISVEIRDVGAMVEIAIEDNGMGMDAEAAEHAFDAMYRGRTDREVPGHGLGLAIVARTTSALGGDCELSSAIDQGTRITVRLPRA
jgi:signal transduction histidine kinase